TATPMPRPWRAGRSRAGIRRAAGSPRAPASRTGSAPTDGREPRVGGSVKRMPTALITGASSGLGAEFARQLAARGADLVLVARDRQTLLDSAAELRARFGVAVEVLVADLTSRRQLAAAERRVASDERPVEILVNNAGFGLPLAFERNDIDDEVTHLRLHVEASMRLMHAA